MTQDHDKARPMCDDKREELRTDLAWLKAWALKALNGPAPVQDDYRRFCARLERITACVRLGETL